jgi:hypothetical protein
MTKEDITQSTYSACKACAHAPDSNPRYMAMYAMLNAGYPRSEVSEHFCCNRATTYRAEKYARNIICSNPEQSALLYQLMNLD